MKRSTETQLGSSRFLQTWSNLQGKVTNLCQILWTLELHTDLQSYPTCLMKGCLFKDKTHCLDKFVHNNPNSIKATKRSG